MRCRACTASCYQMAVTASVAGERYSLVCFCWACSVHVLAPICQTAFVAPRPHERELSGHERSTCTAVHVLPAATRWQSQLASLASATRLFASAWRWRSSAREPSRIALTHCLRVLPPRFPLPALRAEDLRPRRCSTASSSLSSSDEDCTRTGTL